MANEDRLTPLDASFLHLEDDSSHMHVASVLVCEGEPPEYDDFVEFVSSRLHLVPRYRQKLAEVPLAQARPRWIDDPHFNPRYHVRATGLPRPGSEEELRQLAGRVFSQQLDRSKPLWELWLVDKLEGGRFAILSKTHHAMVDGISGLDILSVLFGDHDDGERAPVWTPRPEPSAAQLIGEALLERATVPGELLRPVRALLRRPRQALGRAAELVAGAGALAFAGGPPAPASPYNTTISSHRRFAWVRADLADLKAIKNELGGTVNDVVLTIVARALRRHLGRRGVDTADLELRAMVPVSVRTEDQQGTLGNQVAAIMAPVPVHCEDPATCLAMISESMNELKDSGQAVGARVLTDLTGFAPPTIVHQASRLVARQRFFNLVVTNVPGPQFPLDLDGRELKDIFPMVPLASNQALGVAIVSYNGTMNFGLVGDYDAMADLDDLADDFSLGLRELADAAGVTLATAPEKPRVKRAASPRSNGAAKAKAEPALTGAQGESRSAPER